LRWYSAAWIGGPRYMPPIREKPSLDRIDPRRENRNTFGHARALPIDATGVRTCRSWFFRYGRGPILPSNSYTRGAHNVALTVARNSARPGRSITLPRIIDAVQRFLRRSEPTQTAIN
jgi:hypothetical protein